MPLRAHLAGLFDPPPDPEVLTDADGWTADPEFWPAYLLVAASAWTAPLSFDADPADVEQYAEALHDTDCWPHLTVDLHSGHRLHILFRNHEDDLGLDYLLQPAGTDDLIEVVTLEGHFRGPALSWSELETFADRPRALLLLLPMLGADDRPADAGGRVSAALTAVGVRRNRRKLARELLTPGNRMWGSVEWVERAGALVCLGRHSVRGPDCPPERRALLAEAFGGG
ncbi:hypothetical protein Ait01nite_022970 [Actinoplanes italicus]|uniref:Uncharacterized protein n=1 Tax=Actinoplanes italicus TaxID=113567 RepID=A0A2T0KNK6_9ACTN|nr:hypothetical protein [Actinoplanes italicus]PRX25309.1 hypothetical protein CLV67_10121 [Actinoplanes italicus]GIE29252.1 hypothetical protein Ait01nite_022970 [Actinoplanes italicus]